MTITTRIRICSERISYVELLDAVSVRSGAVPGRTTRTGGAVEGKMTLRNHRGQGLHSALHVVQYDEVDHGESDYPLPPALTELWMDNPATEEGLRFQAEELIPWVAVWLTEHGVHFADWWWRDEWRDEWLGGDVDPAYLIGGAPADIPRWEP